MTSAAPDITLVDPHNTLSVNLTRLWSLSIDFQRCGNTEDLLVPLRLNVALGVDWRAVERMVLDSMKLFQVRLYLPPWFFDPPIPGLTGMPKKDDPMASKCALLQESNRPARMILATGLALSVAVGVVCFFVWHINQPNPDDLFHTAQEAARIRLGPNGPIAQALDLYKFGNGRYPEQLRDLVVARESPGSPTKWRGPYLLSTDYIKDPWGHEFRYIRTQKVGPSGPVEGFKTWSIGPDGRDQTADDIHNP